MTQYYHLSNDVQIPLIGYGTWQTPDGDIAEKSVAHAIKSGYRHIDAAAVYANEKSVGEGIRLSGIERKELFVTSKVWNTERGYESTLRAFEQTLRDLQLDYLDLYLIHWPASAHQFANWEEINAETWRAMEKLYRNGKIRAIGVSNFMPHHLDALLAQAEIKPMVNQIEFHPGFMQQACVDYCRQHEMLVEAWSPLGTGAVLGNEQLKLIADKHGKSVAQVCLRWVLQHEVLPLAKSITANRIEENLNIFDFMLTLEEMQTIDALPPCGGQYLDPDKVDF